MGCTGSLIDCNRDKKYAIGKRNLYLPCKSDSIIFTTDRISIQLSGNHNDNRLCICVQWNLRTFLQTNQLGPHKKKRHEYIINSMTN